MTTLDAALGLLAAALAWEWRVARQDALIARQAEDQVLAAGLVATDQASRTLRHAAALLVWR